MRRAWPESAQQLSPDSHFFILGAPKSGTTSFVEMLRQHPSIAISKPKEPRFFNDDRTYRRGLGFYEKFFGHRHDGQLTGDASITYFAGPDTTIARIAEFYAGCPPRFILMLRDPVDRVWSEYLHRRRTMVEERSFAEAVEADLALAPGQQKYLRHSMYGENFERWLQAFPSRDYFLIETLDELENNLDALMQRTFSFLEAGTPPLMPQPRHLNKATTSRYPTLMSWTARDTALKRVIKNRLPYRIRRNLALRIRRALTQSPETAALPVLDESTRHELARHFHDDLTAFAELSGCDLSAWPSYPRHREGPGA